MKTIAVWNYYTALSTQNYMLTHDDAPIGDGLLAPFVDLARIGESRGVEFITLDMVADPSKLDGILFVDMPPPDMLARCRDTAPRVPLYLLTFEPVVVKWDNWDYEKHHHFRRVFTWADNWLAGGEPRYVKIHYAVRLPREMPDFMAPERLCCMIAGNKRSDHADELYTTRRRDATWFAENAPAALGLYGPGWPVTPVYRGEIPPGGKHDVLRRHTFSLCYENARGIPGYVTEKILDCMLAGCIPVYLGAPNVEKYVPRECFIDRRDFLSMESLHRFMVEMLPSARLKYLTAIRDFIGTPASRHFSTEHFAETILREVA